MQAVDKKTDTNLIAQAGSSAAAAASAAASAASAAASAASINLQYLHVIM